MTILLIILWLALGVLAVMNMYYTAKKDWYNTFGEDSSKLDSDSSKLLWCVSPVIILAGAITFILYGIMLYISFGNKAFSYYFQVPEDENLNT